jgi:hypothetical protein
LQAEVSPDERASFIKDIQGYIKESFNGMIFKHFIQVFLDTFHESPHILLQNIHLTAEPGAVSVEFYSEVQSIAAEYRKYMFAERLTFTDCQVLSKCTADRYAISNLPVDSFAKFCSTLLSILYD